VSVNLEELDYEKTAIGELILRRRRFPTLGERDVFEVILNDEFLMSSLYTAGEIALADLALAATGDDRLNVIVGGLGLGYTAATVLECDRVGSLQVIEALPNVIAWHERELLPVSSQLTGDARCTFHEGDFFEHAAHGFTDVRGGHRCDAVLLDIDHSPRHVLHPSNRDFYSAAGLSSLHDMFDGKGIFALWSNDPPDDDFIGVLGDVFATTSAQVIEIDNPLTGITGHNTIYVATV